MYSFSHSFWTWLLEFIYMQELHTASRHRFPNKYTLLLVFDCEIASRVACHYVDIDTVHSVSISWLKHIEDGEYVFRFAAEYHRGHRIRSCRDCDRSETYCRAASSPRPTAFAAGRLRLQKCICGLASSAGHKSSDFQTGSMMGV